MINIDATFLRLLAAQKNGRWEPVLNFVTRVPEMECRVCGDRATGLDNIKMLISAGVGCVCDGK